MKIVLASLALLASGVQAQRGPSSCGNRGFAHFVKSANSCFNDEDCKQAAMTAAAAEYDALINGERRDLGESPLDERRLPSFNCLDQVLLCGFGRRRLEGIQEEVEEEENNNEETRSLRGNQVRQLIKPNRQEVEEYLNEPCWYDLDPETVVGPFKGRIDAEVVDNLGLEKAADVAYYLQGYECGCVP